MIDTIKLKIPIDLEAYKAISKYAMIHVGIQRGMPEVNPKYFITKMAIDVGSYSRSIYIVITQQFIENGENFIYLEMSVPKYVFGHNVKMLTVEGFHEAMKELSKELELLKITSPMEKWEVMRLDFCYSWKLKNKDELEKSLRILQNLKYPRKRKFNYNTSVMFKGSAYTVKFYSKYEEFMKHDFNWMLTNKHPHLEDVIELAENILRFEVTIRRTHFITIFKKKPVFIREITEDIVLDTLQIYLEKLIKLVDMEYSKDITVFEKLVDTFGEVKGRDIYEKYKLYISKNPTDQEVFNTYSYPNRYKFRKHLEKAGVGIQTEDLGFQLSLTIPSENAVY